MLTAALVAATVALGPHARGSSDSQSALTERSRQTASDAAPGDRFGAAVALSGTVAVVGAPGSDAAGLDSGAVYVLEADGAGWRETMRLLPGSVAADDRFGSAVAIGVDGARIVVGAPGSDLATSDGGAAYVFERFGASWIETSTLVAPDSGAGDALGSSVAIDGDTILVGAPLDNAPVVDSGSAYVFVDNLGTWSLQKKLRRPSGAMNPTHFGHAVALTGDTAFVGAPESGNARVFERVGGVWQDGRTIQDATGGQAGWALATSGERLLVGDPADVPRTGGRVSVVERGTDGWEAAAELRPHPHAQGDGFGSAVALDGDLALIGARDHGGTGAVFLFQRFADGSWRQNQRLVARDVQAGSKVLTVALSGQHALASVSPGVGDTARLHGFGLSDADNVQIAPISMSADLEPQISRGFGEDIDADGQHLIVGAPDACYGGRAQIYADTGAGWELAEEILVGQRVGQGVALDGDTALAGAPQGTNGGCFIPGNRGKVFVRTLVAGTWIPSRPILAPVTGDSFGISVDLDEGTALIGGPYSPTGGHAYVFTRNGSEWDQAAELVASDAAPGDRFGRASAIDGDFAVLGATGVDAGAEDSGAAYVFERFSGVWAEVAKLVPSDVSAFEGVGSSVAIAGDTIALGAPGVSSRPTQVGAVYVFRRTPQGWREEAKIVPNDGVAYDDFGASVSLEGARLLVTSSGNQSAYVYLRGGSTWIFDRKLLTSGEPVSGVLVGERAALGVRRPPAPFSFPEFLLEIYDVLPRSPSFCDASDGALAACPCGNPGIASTGCDTPGGRGGIQLEVLSQSDEGPRRATLSASGFPAGSLASGTLLRSSSLEPGGAVVFGDGLRCLALPVTRVGAGQGTGGAIDFTVRHGPQVGVGTFFYQLHFRSTPAAYCDQTAAFNMSSGRAVTWR